MRLVRFQLAGMTLVASLFLAPVFGASKATTDAERDRVWNQYFVDHLPEFCKYTQALPSHGNKATAGLKGDFYHPLSTGKYRRLFGANWDYMHHYCMGLEDLHRAVTVGRANREYWTRAAVQEFDFVLARVTSPFVLHAEGLLNRGLAHLELEQYVDAVYDFTSALEIDPRYVPAYVALIDHFQRFGDTEEAIAIARKGLEHAPGSAILESRLAELEPPFARSTETPLR